MPGWHEHELDKNIDQFRQRKLEARAWRGCREEIPNLARCLGYPAGSPVVSVSPEQMAASSSSFIIPQREEHRFGYSILKINDVAHR